MTELELKGDDFSDVLHSFDLITQASTVLIDSQVAIYTSSFATITWLESESWKDFLIRFNTLKKKLESCKVEIPEQITRNNLLLIIKKHFPAYFAVYDSNKALTINQLMEAIDGLQLQASTSASDSHLSSDSDISKLSNTMINAVLAAHLKSCQWRRAEHSNSAALGANVVAREA